MFTALAFGRLNTIGIPLSSSFAVKFVIFGKLLTVPLSKILITVAAVLVPFILINTLLPCVFNVTLEPAFISIVCQSPVIS